MVAANGLYQSVRNYETGTRVIQTLLSFDEARFGRIQVVAFCGIVEISGEVTSYFDKLLALGIAEKVEGVTTVVESIRIKAANHSRDGLDRRHQRQSEAVRDLSKEGVTRRFDFPHD